MESAQSIQQVNAELLQRLIQHGPDVQSDIQVHKEEPKRAGGSGQTHNTEDPSITTAIASTTCTTETPIKLGFEPRRRFMVEGRIIHKRKLSRKLFFLDLSLSRHKQRLQLPEVKDVVASTSETGSGSGSEHDTQKHGTNAPKESEWEDVLPEQQPQQGEEPDHSTGRSRGLQRMEVIGRYPTHSLKDLDDLWHRVQLGAVFRVFGDIELSEWHSSAGPTTEGQDQAATEHRWSVLLHVLDFEVLEVWQGKESFEPNPGSAEMGLSKKGAKKQQQQQQQQQQPSQEKTGSKKRKSSDLGEQPDQPLDRGDASQPHCKFWLNSGKCNKQKCDFWHETDQAKLKTERRRWVEERIQAKRQLSHHSCDPHQATTKNQHRERSLYFAQWLIQTFTREFLESGSGVLDIAGGRGDLSWELQTRQGVRSTIVEPRPGKGMRKWQRKWLEKFVAENRDKGDITDAVGKGERDGIPQEEEKEEHQACDGNVAKKQKTGTGEDKDEDEDDDKEPEDGGDKDSVLSSFVPTVKTYPLQTTEPARIQALMDDAFLQTHRELVASASVLIGLHPDQATEPIVRAALTAGKPFAIIPCCVFGRDNPHRRLPVVVELEGGESGKNVAGEENGMNKKKDVVVQGMDVDRDQETGTRAVTSYEDFVTWLTTLHPGIETTWLNFEGMNRVLFWRGGSGGSISK